jgi:CubicO group peptidase (beta-lactamase class C family)
VFQQYDGLANIEQDQPVSSATNFRLASVTKQFTAMCILLLRERQQLDFQDRLVDIFPDFPAYGAAIKIQHLLHHTSGLMAYESLLPRDLKSAIKDSDVLQLMYRAEKTCFAPGEKFQYSNSGYAVLAMIVEKISGQNFAEFLRKNIFLPLKMEETVAYEDGVSSVSYRAYGYRNSNGAWLDADQNLTSAVLGDGGIYCSMNDYLRWSAAFDTELLLPVNVMQSTWQAGLLNNGQFAPYGLGWRLDLTGERQVVYHPGSTTGFNNYVLRMPHCRRTIVLLSNRSGRETHDLAPEIEVIMSSHDRM